MPEGEGEGIAEGEAEGLDEGEGEGAQSAPYTVSISTVGGGSVSLDPEGPYDTATSVTVTATPDLDSVFDYWGRRVEREHQPGFAAG